MIFADKQYCIHGKFLDVSNCRQRLTGYENTAMKSVRNAKRESLFPILFAMKLHFVMPKHFLVVRTDPLADVLNILELKNIALLIRKKSSYLWPYLALALNRPDCKYFNLIGSGLLSAY